MLARCRAKIAAEPSEVQGRVQLVEADMRQLDLDGTFSAVLMPFRSLQHQLTVADQLATLERAYRHVIPDGVLVLDVFHPALGRLAAPAVDEQEDTPLTTLPDGRQFRRTGRVTAVHTAEQISDVELAYYVTAANSPPQRRVQSFQMRWFFRYELEHLLARAGFTVEAIYGNFDESPLTDGAPEIIVVARRVDAGGS
jgi:SAM-dependent methyltransferase